MFTKTWLPSVALSLIFLRSIQSSIAIPKKVYANDYAHQPGCHRNMQPGKRTTHLHVERVINCRNVQDCREACDYEMSFVCKGFNYRRGTSVSKDTCELTSIPYIRMDLDRDFLTDSRYDYYERDANCVPPAWRVPWTDRSTGYGYDYGYGYGYDYDYGQRRKDAWSRSDRDRAPQHLLRESSPVSMEDRSSFYTPNRQFPADFSDRSNLRADKQFPYETPRDFASDPNTPDWNGNWQAETSQVNPSQYFGIGNENSVRDARINYDAEYSKARSSVFSESRLGDRSHAFFFRPSAEKDQLDGKLYNYGSAFGYSENYVPTSKESAYGTGPDEKLATRRSKCSIRIAAGSKLSRGRLRKTCLVRDSKQCEELCIDETSFSCGSFAYRYNVLATNPTDNCLLSDLSYQDLSFYTDLEPDRGFDSFVVIEDSMVCSSMKSTNRNPSEECFSRVRSGFGIPSDITKKSMFVNDLGECQFACTMSQEFVCRSFAFKYTADYQEQRAETQEGASANCFLTDWSSGEINPANMPDTDGAELYERSSSSTFGCEPYALPLSLSTFDASTWEQKKSSPGQFAGADELCYSEHRKPCRLMPHAVVSSRRTATKSECRRTCSAMKKIGTIPCMSFAYTTIAPDTAPDNCLLSDISIRDLTPNLDYTHDDAHLLYTWNDFDPYCRLSDPTNTVTSVPEEHEPHQNPHPYPYPYPHPTVGQATFDDETRLDLSPRMRNQFKPENHDRDSWTNLADRPSPPPPPPPASAVFHHGLTLFHPRELSTFRRYTVSGHPCKNGTVCQRNQLAGFWSCETEDGENDGWDYCCEPNHRCGFSLGYRYPWCYVGLNEDQWRPCSETYYPYQLAKEHSFYRQSPAYSARHWPIIYLHDTSPPNCTLDRNSNESRQLLRRGR